MQRELDVPMRPVPDWSKAPEWAQWWAIDPDCNVTWHKKEPEVIFWYWFSEGGETDVGNFVDIPLGIDWRTLKEKRPDAV